MDAEERMAEALVCAGDNWAGEVIRVIGASVPVPFRDGGKSAKRSRSVDDLSLSMSGDHDLRFVAFLDPFV